MNVRSIDLYHVAVPLRRPIKHASHERTVSDNLVVRATLADGTTGFGEGVPRSYVTGETIDSTFEMLGRFELPRHLGSPCDLPTVVRRLDLLLDVRELSDSDHDSDPRGMHGNAARCALELAVLDAYCRAFGCSLTDALRLADDPDHVLLPAPVPVRYSGAITAETPAKEQNSAWKMRLYGFRQVKVKVGVPDQDDPARLARFRRILGRRTDIRLDANEAWQPCELAERVRDLIAFRPSALEQPVPHEQVDRLSDLRPGLGVPVMLDESLCSYGDGIRAVLCRLADVFNVRLSKCGGLLPSLRLVGLARRSGLAVQLGCHPGETGILSAAGRHFAANVGPLRYVEGSYDRHVLAENLTVEDITFRYGGRARPLQGPGLGVVVDPARLERLSVRHEEVRYD
jgi:muconate cycloisomerase